MLQFKCKRCPETRRLYSLSLGRCTGGIFGQARAARSKQSRRVVFIAVRRIKKSDRCVPGEKARRAFTLVRLYSRISTTLARNETAKRVRVHISRNYCAGSAHELTGQQPRITNGCKKFSALLFFTFFPFFSFLLFLLRRRRYARTRVQVTPR